MHRENVEPQSGARSAVLVEPAVPQPTQPSILDRVTASRPEP